VATTKLRLTLRNVMARSVIKESEEVRLVVRGTKEIGGEDVVVRLGPP
jgi:hypothetical protein